MYIAQLTKILTVGTFRMVLDDKTSTVILLKHS